MSKKSNKKPAHIQAPKRFLTYVIALIIVIFTLMFFVSRRYNMVVQTSLPKKVGILRLESFSWKLESAKNAMTPPATGHHYISVNINITNLDNKALWLTPVNQSYIKDKQGNQYGIEMVGVKDPFQGQSYLPNTPAKGELAYMVPDSKNDLQWCYDLGQADKSKILCQDLDSKLLSSK